MSAELRDVDWNGHIPTAPYSAIGMTRKQVTDANAGYGPTDEAASDNDRWLPTVPRPRRSPEQTPKVPGQRTSAYDREVLATSHLAPAPLPTIGYDDAWGRPGAWDL